MNLVYKHILISLLAMTLINGCARGSRLNWDEDVNFKFKPIDSKIDVSTFEPLAWEKKSAKNKEWSKMVYSIIHHEEPQILGEKVADDIEDFCPKYNTLNNNQRLNFWGQLFAAIALPESSWNPIDRFTEKKFKYKDSVTGLPVVSEGLLQLSYQDEKSHKLDCGFDWNKDRNLTLEKRSILDPYQNLRCGIKIMAKLLKKYHAIQLSEGKYWSVLVKGDDDNKTIRSLTQSLKFCK